VLQMELRYIHNACEVELLKRSEKLCSEGLFVELEIISDGEFRRYERIAIKQLKTGMGIKNIKSIMLCRRKRMASCQMK
jgi:hypothetical protein